MHRPIDETESSEISPQIYGRMFFDKYTQTIQGEKTASLINSKINCVGKTGQPHAKE